MRQAGATLEQRIKKRDNGGTAYADLEWKPRVLIEMKKAGRDLTRDYRQAFEYWIDMVPDRPEFVVLCNFDEFWIYDLNSQLDEPVDRVSLDDLPRRWEALAFLLPASREADIPATTSWLSRETPPRRCPDVFNAARTARHRSRLSAAVHLAGGDGDVLRRTLVCFPSKSFTKAIQDVRRRRRQRL